MQGHGKLITMDSNVKQSLYSPHPEISVRDAAMNGAELTVVLEGQIRNASTRDLRGYLTNLVTVHSPQSMVLDFAEITFVDSQGLALLINLYKLCAANGCPLSISHATPLISSLMSLTRLNQFIQVI